MEWLTKYKKWRVGADYNDREICTDFSTRNLVETGLSNGCVMVV